MAIIEHTEKDKALLLELQSDADRLRLAVRSGRDPLFYYLAKRNLLTDEDERLCGDCALEIIQDKLAKYAEAFNAAKSTWWRVQILENSETRYEPDPRYLTVEIREIEKYAPTLAQREALRYGPSLYRVGTSVTCDLRSSSESVGKPTREADDKTPGGCPVWIER